MIGVLAKNTEKNVVEEFFQLFKIPWEFCVESKEYDCVISMNGYLPIVKTKTLISYSPKLNSRMPSQCLRVVPSTYRINYLEHEGERVPIYGEVAAISNFGTPMLKLEEGEGYAGSRTEVSGQTNIHIGYNLLHEIEFLLTSGQPIKNAHIPTLDLHISILRAQILSSGLPVVELLPMPSGCSFITCLTHDVDFIKITDYFISLTILGFLYRATIGSTIVFVKRRLPLNRLLKNWKAVLSLPLVYLGIIKDFWLQFEEYLSIENGVKSTYFFIPFKFKAGDRLSFRRPGRRASHYDIADVAHWAKILMDKGHEIGVHGIDGWHDRKKGQEELRRFAEFTGVEIPGVRTHWLCSDSNSTKELEEAGYSYDSTFGYNETIGFRSGSTQVFRPFGGRDLLEIPINIQDVSLFYPSYLNLTDNEAWEKCTEIIEKMHTYGGVLNVLWHMRSLGPERLWRDFYVRLLDELKKHSVWFATCGEVSNWFKIRRSVIFEGLSFSPDCVNVSLTSNVSVDGYKLAIRAYKPWAGERSVHIDHNYIDFPWDGQETIDISFE